MRKIKYILASLGLAFAFVGFIGGATVLAADIQGSLCQGANLEVGTDGTCEPASKKKKKVNDLVTDIINIFSWVVGVICVIMIIFGGFRYVTSGGASDKVTSAKNTIMYALIGLVIVALSQIIVKFVLSKVTTSVSG